MRFKKQIVDSKTIDQWTDNNDNPFASYQDLIDYLDPFFFRKVSGGSGGVGYGLNRVVFQENFIGDGVTTLFQLDGTIQNAVYQNGSWIDSRIVTTSLTEVVRSDNFNRTYDGVPNFTANKIVVNSVSATGLVTLSHPPRAGIGIAIFYWYDLAVGDILDDYERPDIVAVMEADNTRIYNVINNHTSNTNNPHLTTVSNLNDTLITAPVDDEVLTYEGGAWKNKPIPVSAYSLDEQTFDVTNDALPITTSASTTKLKVDFSNFNADIDLTGQLPVNMSAGSQVVLRKLETNRFKVIYDDGSIIYNFVNRKGDYLTLEWTGSKFII